MMVCRDQPDLWARFEQMAEAADVRIRRENQQWVLTVTPSASRKPVSFTRPRLLDAVALAVRHYEAFLAPSNESD